jgi:hypothetical protein
MRSFGIVFVALTTLGLSTVAVLAADLDPKKCTVPTDDQAKRGCICMLPIKSPPPTGIVLLDKIKGDVLVSAMAGFTPVTQPTWLNVGDSVLVKSASQATLVAGVNCQRTVGPNVSLIIKEIDNECACAALTGEQTAGLPHTILAVGAGIGIGILLRPPPVSP